MPITIALAGNPNCGKTTLFNHLTGGTQHVGNWPGVTVEKKAGYLKGLHHVVIMDLPGIYSLSPYSLEEMIARNYLINDRPDVIINIIDATNLERNLYLTTQLRELGIPIVIALNMMDIVRKRGDSIHTLQLEKKLGCPVIEISAVKGSGMKQLMTTALEMFHQKVPPISLYKKNIHNCLQEIASLIKQEIPSLDNLQWYSVRLFDRDDKILKELALSESIREKIEQLILVCEEAEEDDSECILVNERYHFIENMVGQIMNKKPKTLTTSDKIDKIVTNKWLALPIFFMIMWFIYYVSISTIGDYTIVWVENICSWIESGVESFLVSLKASNWSVDLVVNGIIGSLGAVFTFVPQIMILFLFLSILEDSGYMARVAFIMDCIFRKFGLSGKSFIPMLIGTGCSVPGVMASRTIEDEQERKMTIMLTPFVPCGAKLPVFAMFIALVFPHQSWIGPMIYLIALAGIIVSGILLKGTKRFGGDATPFIMELPEYKLPHAKGVLIHMWDKAKSFIKKAGTIIFISCTVLWLLQSFNTSFQYIGTSNIDESILAAIGNAIKWFFVPLGFGDSWAAPIATITGLIAKEVVVATFASIGTVMTIEFTQVTAFAFMVFTIFAAPCFATIGAMHREFGHWKMTVYAVCYQTGLAYVLAMLINVIGSFIFHETALTKSVVLDPSKMAIASEGAMMDGNIVWFVFATILIFGLIVLLRNYVKTVKQDKTTNLKKGA